MKFRIRLSLTRYQQATLFAVICGISVATINMNGLIDALGKTASDPILEVVWSNIYARPDEQYPSQFISTTGGGYLLVGSSDAYSVEKGTHGVGWVVKTDANGVHEWNKSYYHHLKPLVTINSVVQTPDDGYVLGGHVGSGSFGTVDIWVLKVDAKGDVQWNKTFNGLESSNDYGSQILVAGDGGLLIIGSTHAHSVTSTDLDSDYWLIKMDAMGNEEWNKTYHRVGFDYGFMIVPLSDDNYLLGGSSRKTADLESPSLIWILKIDQNGSIHWSKTYRNDQYDYMDVGENQLIETTDGGFLLVSNEVGDESKEYWTVKANSTGDVEWTTVIDNKNYAKPYVCVQSPSGDYYIGGCASPSKDQESNMCIVKVNSLGTFEWKATHINTELGETIVDMSFIEGIDLNETFLAFGRVESSSGTSNSDFWFGKLQINLDTSTKGTPGFEMGILVLTLTIGLLWFNRRKKHL